MYGPGEHWGAEYRTDCNNYGDRCDRDRPASDDEGPRITTIATGEGGSGDYPKHQRCSRYPQAEGLSVLKEGLVEINEISPQARAEEPIVSLGEVPFVFTTLEDHRYFVIEQFYPACQAVFDRNDWNVTVFAPYLDPSPVYFFSKDPLPTFDDFQGLELRTWGGIVADAMQIIGAEPFTIGMADLYTSLQRGMVEAAITSYRGSTEAHFWEVLDYINKVPVLNGTWLICVNNDALNALPDDLQKVFWDSALNYRNYVVTSNMLVGPVLEKMLVDGGMEIVIPDPDVAIQMKKKLVDVEFYKTIADEAGPEAIQLFKDLGAY